MGAVEQEAEGGLVAAPDAAPQLVQLGKAEAFGAFNDHNGGFRHIDADFDDRCSDEQARSAGTEVFERGILV